MIFISRIEIALRKYGGRLADRVYTSAERAYCARPGKGYPSLAARWAAKEATMKALNLGLWQFPFTNIEVTGLSGGQPQLVLSGLAKARADEKGIDTWHVSLSHANDYAVALVIGERRR